MMCAACFLHFHYVNVFSQSGSSFLSEMRIQVQDLKKGRQKKRRGERVNKWEGMRKNLMRFGQGRRDMLCVNWLMGNQALLIWTHREVFTLEERGNDEDSLQGLCSFSHKVRASPCWFWTNLASAPCSFQHALSCFGLNAKHSRSVLLNFSIHASFSLCVCAMQLCGWILLAPDYQYTVC